MINIKKYYCVLHKLILDNYSILLALLVLLSLIERMMVLWDFGLKFSDCDQMLLWQTATDMSNGNFYSPVFYGQLYNPNIEPLFSIPLILIGFHPSFALPFTTNLLLICSFLFFSLAMGKENKVYALFPWIILIALPVSFQMFTIMPRGWVGAMFTSSLSFWAFQYNKGVSSFLAALTLWFNPAFIIILILLLAKKFWQLDKKNKLMFVAGGVIGLMPNLLTVLYFKYNPDLIVHSSPKISFSIDNWGLRMLRLDSDYFRTITPYMWRNGHITLLLLLFFGWKARKIDKFQMTIYYVSFFLFFCFTFLKAMDNVTMSIYMTGGRYFLFYPFIFCLYLKEIYLINKNTLQFFLLYAICLSAFKIFTVDKQIEKFNVSFDDKNDSFVTKNTTIASTCESLSDFAKKADVIINVDEMGYRLHYGCSSYGLRKKFWIKNDRRSFESQEKMNTEIDFFVLGKNDNDNVLRNPDTFTIIEKHPTYGWLLVKPRHKMKLKDIILKLED